MKLRTPWDTIRTHLEEFDLPPFLEKTVRWVERHPRTVLATGLVVVLALLLAQSPGEATGEYDAYNGETPLFV